jgi:hypothetical protein
VSLFRPSLIVIEREHLYPQMKEATTEAAQKESPPDTRKRWVGLK